jgi:penicillin amidase
MKIVKFLVCLAITSALIYCLNRSWGQIPALGKFLDPFHGFWKNATASHGIESSIEIPGLQGEVRVLYDSMLIPHIYASNDHDLYMAQGYVTAQHRLWQMEFQTHAGAGRISELIGDGALDFDRTQRRIGMMFGAERSLKTMENNPVAREAITAYTEGINAYISTLDFESLPLEYKLLGYEPEPWTNLKCAILLKNMAKTLNMGEKDMEMTNAVNLFGKEVADLLFPDREEVGDPIVDKPGGWKFNPIKLDSFPMAIPKDLIARDQPAPALRRSGVREGAEAKPAPALRLSGLREGAEAGVGSNNWAVHGSKTKTGAPLLSNDPHLTLSLPSIWFVVHLNAPGVNVMGASLPGAPAVIIGFNDSIAWGMTNAQRDLVDLYNIRFKDKTMSEYFSDSTWKKTTRVIEEFKIKGKPSFFDTITYTHHGPITYDAGFHGNDQRAQFAFRWIAHDPSDEVMTFYMLNRAKNHGDYMHALNYFSSPAQNIVFASVSGDIAMRVQGKFPVRRSEEGKYVLDGTRTAFEWHAFIPNEQNVMDKNPERGFVSSANQYPVDATYPYYITASSYEAYRNRRINSVLSKLTAAEPQDMMRLQFDTYNLKAAESLPNFLQALDSTSFNDKERTAYQILKSWNLYNDPDSEGASYYEAWWDALRPLIWDEMENDKALLDYPTTFTTIKLLKQQPTLSFFDILSTPEKENAGDLLRKSFALGVQDIEEWKSKREKQARWADFKDTYIGHLARLEPLSVRVQHGGNHDIVNASTRTHGPSWRMVVSLEKEGVKAWGVYPGGQSGNPGSPYYSNMVELWGQGKYFSLPFADSASISRRMMVTQKLNVPTQDK